MNKNVKHNKLWAPTKDNLEHNENYEHQPQEKP